MTPTVSLENLPTNPHDVSVDLYTYANFLLRGSTQAPDGSVYTAEYVLDSGNPTLETTISFRIAYDKDGTKRTSMRLRTVEQITDSGVVTKQAPVDVFINWNTAGAFEDTALLMKQIGAAFGLTFKTLVSKVPQTDVLDPVNRNILVGIFG